MSEDTEFESIAPNQSGPAEPAAQSDSCESSASMGDEHAPGEPTPASPGTPEVSPSSVGANSVWKIGEEPATPESFPSQDGTTEAEATTDALDASVPAAEATKVTQQLGGNEESLQEEDGTLSSTHHTTNSEEPATPEPVTSQGDTTEAAATTDALDASVPAREATKVTYQLSGIEESLQREDGTLRSVQFRYAVTSKDVPDFRAMIALGSYRRDPLKRIPLPSRNETYGTTGELFARLKTVISEQTQLSDRDSALLTYWVFSTWCQDVLQLAPGLAITGWAPEGDAVLRVLSALAYHPVLMVGVTAAMLDHVGWERKPTLLISDLNPGKRMAVQLASSTRRGYLAFRKVAGLPAYPFDYFSSKAIFLGKDSQMISELQNYLHIDASSVHGTKSTPSFPLSDEATQRFQNQLLDYRINNLQTAFNSQFRVSELSPETNAIATALGQCIVGAPELQADLVTLLTPYSDQEIADRVDDLGSLAVGAAFKLCHGSGDQVLVGQIAREANRILKERGERLQYSPEKIGHRLRKAGLLTHRLGAAGNGLLFDLSTRIHIHELAWAYGYVGSADGNENLHCTLCAEKG